MSRRHPEPLDLPLALLGPRRNPHQLRLNAYRVLLTRGRDGMAIFVPPRPELDSTSAALAKAGVLPID